MDLDYFLGIQVFKLRFPLEGLISLPRDNGSQVSSLCVNIFFEGGNDSLKARDLVLKSLINRLGMLKSSLLQVKHLLALLIKLYFDGTLASKDRLFHGFHALEERFYLVAEHCLLVSQGYQVLLFCPSNDLVHGGHALLELLHQTAFAFQTHFLFSAQFLRDTQELIVDHVSHLIFGLHPMFCFLIHPPFDLADDILDIVMIRFSSLRLHALQASSLIFSIGKERELVLPVLLQALSDF